MKQAYEDWKESNPKSTTSYDSFWAGWEAAKQRKTKEKK
jgi:hypothetical protein